MIESIILFEKILIDPPYKKIYQRLGFKGKTTELSSKQRAETDNVIEEALGLIALKGSMLRTVITQNDGNSISLQSGLTLAGKQLAGFLHGCPEALLMGTTAGNQIMNALRAKSDEGNLFAAVIYDATASEMADAALDWIMGYTDSQIRREGKKILSRRFSAGYGDFHLSNQKAIHQKLQMEKIGVAINENFILLPEKSVTAISGIGG